MMYQQITERGEENSENIQNSEYIVTQKALAQHIEVNLI